MAIKSYFEAVTELESHECQGPCLHKFSWMCPDCWEVVTRTGEEIKSPHLKDTLGRCNSCIVALHKKWMDNPLSHPSVSSIIAAIAAGRGSVRELMKASDRGSASTRALVKRLERDGIIVREPDKARAIRLTGKQEAPLVTLVEKDERDGCLRRWRP